MRFNSILYFPANDSETGNGAFTKTRPPHPGTAFPKRGDDDADFRARANGSRQDASGSSAPATRVAHTGTYPRAAARTRTHRSAVRESVWQGGRRPGREAPGGGDRST